MLYLLRDLFMGGMMVILFLGTVFVGIMAIKEAIFGGTSDEAIVPVPAPPSPAVRPPAATASSKGLGFENAGSAPWQVTPSGVAGQGDLEEVLREEALRRQGIQPGWRPGDVSSSKVPHAPSQLVYERVLVVTPGGVAASTREQLDEELLRETLRRMGVSSEQFEAAKADVAAERFGDAVRAEAIDVDFWEVEAPPRHDPTA